MMLYRGLPLIVGKWAAGVVYMEKMLTSVWEQAFFSGN